MKQIIWWLGLSAMAGNVAWADHSQPEVDDFFRPYTMETADRCRRETTNAFLELGQARICRPGRNGTIRLEHGVDIICREVARSTDMIATLVTSGRKTACEANCENLLLQLCQGRENTDRTGDAANAKVRCGGDADVFFKGNGPDILCDYYGQAKSWTRAFSSDANRLCFAHAWEVRKDLRNQGKQPISVDLCHGACRARMYERCQSDFLANVGVRDDQKRANDCGRLAQMVLDAETPASYCEFPVDAGTTVKVPIRCRQLATERKGQYSSSMPACRKRCEEHMEYYCNREYPAGLVPLPSGAAILYDGVERNSTPLLADGGSFAAVAKNDKPAHSWDIGNVKTEEDFERFVNMIYKATEYGKRPFDEVRIYDHGSPGNQRFGDFELTIEFVERRPDLAERLGKSIKPGGKLSFGGCKVGQQDVGESLVRKFGYAMPHVYLVQACKMTSIYNTMGGSAFDFQRKYYPRGK